MVGIGRWGSKHAAALAELRSEGLVDRICIIDIDESRAKRIAKMYGAEVCTLEQAVNTSNAAIVSTPANTHFGIASRFLEAGVHVLVEKPIASNFEEALELARLARDCILTTGFLLRYHPATKLAKDLIREIGGVSAIFATRNGELGSDRTDTDVVGDLMIHDIDLTLFLTGELPRFVYGRTGWYWATALVDFGSFSASYTSSWRVGRWRMMSIVGPRGVIEIDYVSDSVTVRLGDEEIRRIVRGNPLLELDRQFLLAVGGKGGAPPPLRDILVAMAVVDAVRRGHPTDLEPILLKIL